MNRAQLHDGLDAVLDYSLDGLVWCMWRIDDVVVALDKAGQMMWESWCEGWYGPADEVRDMESQDV